MSQKIIESRDIKQTQSGQNYEVEFNIYEGRFTSWNLFYWFCTRHYTLVSNDKANSKIPKTHGKKLYNLFFNNSYGNSVTSHDADKVIFNCSSLYLL